MLFGSHIRLLAVTGALSFGALAQQPYKIVDHWKIGGSGSWDYSLADPSAHLVYVTHGPRVEVIDTKTGKPVAAITGMKRHARHRTRCRRQARLH